MGRIKETRKQILATAKYLFLEYGFDKTSLDEIARASHKAKRSLYNHFNNKEEIYTFVLEEELHNMQTALEKVFNDESIIPPKRIHNYLVQRMELMNQAKAIQQQLKNRVANHGENRFVKIHQLFEHFDAWERKHFLDLSSDKVICEVFNGFDAEAFADMLQMVIKSLDITFFVQGKYAQYKPTFSYMIDRIIQLSFTNITPLPVNNELQ